MNNSIKIKRFYTNSLLSKGGNKNLIDLLICDVENKTIKVVTNVPLSEKEDIYINDVLVKTNYTSRFGFDFTIKVLLRNGYVYDN